MTEAYYELAEMCPNGHHTTIYAQSSPESRSPFCPKCGEDTFTRCPQCEAEIRGAYRVPGVASLGSIWHPSKHCYQCGHAYPWTQGRRVVWSSPVYLTRAFYRLSPQEQAEHLDYMKEQYGDTEFVRLGSS